MSNFSYTILQFFDQFGSVAEQLEAIRKLYEVKNIPNRVVDGTIPYPEDKQKLRSGISIEFRYVACAHIRHTIKSTLQECFLQISR